jgi:uncharacterized protein YjiS (DUF1127 family)
MKISTDAAFAPSGWAGLNHVLSEWWQIQCLRHELESLDDSILRDIGLIRGQQPSEVSKPSWMN